MRIGGKTLLWRWITAVLLLVTASLLLTWRLGRREATLPAVVSETIPGRRGQDPDLPVWKDLQKEPSRHPVAGGDTFESILLDLGLDRMASFRLVEKIRPVFNPRHLRRGRSVRWQNGEGGRYRLEYDIDLLRTLVAERLDGDRIEVRIDEKKVQSRLHVIRGRISYSLFDALASQGERDDLADRLAALFEYDVDFNRDLRQDDRFALLVEKRYVDGDFIEYGRIHAAYLDNDGREITLGWHELTDQAGGYFHPDGNAVEKFFLRCPLPFMRLTSRFGNRRHPVLGFSARHNGIDLGAPVGTPVRCTASGRIRVAGRDSIKGLYLFAVHPNGYETHYYHLNSLASGIRSGKSVAQGQIIAYVGNSGRSTGPHLHYGIKKAGRFINPLSLKTPPKRHLPERELARFRSRLSLQTQLLTLGDPFLQFCLEVKRGLADFALWMSTARETIPVEEE